MMIIKRIISFLICVCIIVISLPTVFAANTEYSYETIEFFKMLDIISEPENKDMSAGMTRAEFTVMLARMIKFDEESESEVRYFDDLSMDHWAQSAINYFAELGVISQPSDKKFNPDNLITYQEAVKMLVSLMGYQPYAEVNGGYPLGYLNAAKKTDILSGININNFTFAEALNLVKNAFIADVFEIKAVKGDNLVYDSAEGMTLLEIYWDIHYVEQEIVQAVYGLSIDEQYKAESSEVYINGTKFNTQFDAEKFVGRTVNFFYRAESNDGDKELLLILPVREDDVTIIAAENYVSNTTRSITWYDTDSQKEKTTTISDKAVVLKNGERIITDVSRNFDIEKGEYRLIDSNNDDACDVVIIYECIVAKVKTIDSQLGVVYARDTKDKAVTFQNNGKKELRVQNEKSWNLDFAAIKEGDVLNIYESANLITVYINNQIVSGVLEKQIKGLNPTISIDGISYPIYPETLDARISSLSFGTSYSFILDRYGKIVFIEADSISAHKFGYLWKVKMNTETFAENAIVLIFTQEGEMLKVYTGEKVTVDGEKVEAKELERTLQGLNGEYANQLVIYTVNDKGILTKIDTAMKGENESKDSLTCIFEENNVAYAGNTYQKFERTGLFPTKNLKFYVPVEEDIATADERHFTADAVNSIKYTHRFNKVMVYTTNSESLVGEVAVIHDSGAIQNDYPILVGGIGSSINDDGEVLETVYINGSSTEKLYIASDYLNTWKSIGVQPGDIIQVSTNNRGEVNEATVLLDFGTDSKPKKLMTPSDYAYADDDYSGGYVLRKDGNVVEWCLGDDIAGGAFERHSFGAVEIIVYDESLRTNKAYVGTIDDILSIDSVGADDASAIYMFGEAGNLRRLIVHKRGW